MTHSAPRLLPWTTPGGQPAYVVGDGTGYVSRIADDMERVQLAMAGELLCHAADLLADGSSTSAQLRYLLARMCESLTAVHRIAESRGARCGEGA
ncbi:hypothetical protein [Streptomyces soliscabiei]|uniref:hypothetical protein n=1 Tax=Streptomyces soliscabiei TaxID=588897 RepID=UPI0029ABE483|nr:hypothetical protein [Streptomyces sp. NY05-11A]MDX2677325.1 hypothetical protein [Streptomyces sp. NY05-11A]